MERDVAERFERIETVLLRNTETLNGIEVNILKLSSGLSNLAKTVGELSGQVGILARSTAQYIEASNVRMTRLEDNMARMEQDLSALIRAITAERTNGHSKS